MVASEPLEILLSHNYWATQSLIDHCQDLDDAQLDQPFEMGPGSLRRTISHILGAMRGWGDLLGGRQQRPRLEQQSPLSLDEMSGLLQELCADLVQSARNHPVEEVLVAERGGKTYRLTRGEVLTHVLTHGVHHRAQCLNMLRHLGCSSLPPSSVLEWTLTARSEQ